ncbi:MAG: DUF547 domain-containing protein [Flavobacteriales bacterium]|nr:DUF547 domain-containing protein [Flavobacteriales bacterium]
MNLNGLTSFAFVACLNASCQAAPSAVSNAPMPSNAGPAAMRHDSAPDTDPEVPLQEVPMVIPMEVQAPTGAVPKSGQLVEAEPAPMEVQAAFDHALWNSLLQAHVSADGMVDYGAFGKDARLAEYLGKLSATKAVDTWPRNERLAFWINAYNAFTIRLMLDHPTVKSIKDINEPWKKKFFSLNGARTNLDQVEHQELREKLGDERIHFAIVCASFSCPQLWNKAFTADGLDKQLDDAARRFINDPKRNVLGGEPQLSEIFNWFKGDFTKKGSLAAYINRYARTPIPADATIKHLDYDWRLNGKR